MFRTTNATGEKSASWRDGAAVALAALIAQAMMLARGLVWDDRLLLSQFHATGLWRLTLPDCFGFVRPGKVLLFSLTDTLFGDHTIGWEAVALATSIAVSVLVWRLARRLVARDAALVAGLIYAVHPLHVEASGWFAALNGMLMVLFGLLYLGVVLDVAEKGAAWSRLGWVSALLAAAVLMKEDGVSLPLIGLALLWYRRARPCGRFWATLAVQFVAIGLFVFWTRTLSAQSGQGLERMPYPDLQLALHGPWMMIQHTLFFVFPFRWEYYWYYNPLPIVLAGLSAVGWITMAALGVAVWRRRNRPSLPLLGVIWAVVAFAPVVNLLPMHNNWFAVRYLALSGVGLALVAGWGVTAAWRARPSWRPAMQAALACWLLGGAAMSGYANWIWRDEVSLCDKMLDEGQWQFHSILASALYERGDYAGAEAQIRQSMLHVRNRGLLMTTLGMILQKTGREPMALAYWRAAQKTATGDVDASANLAFYHDARFGQSGSDEDFALADAAYARAARGITVNSEVAAVNRGILWAQKGEIQKAITIWSDGLKRFPGSVDLRTNLGIARRQLAAAAKEVAEAGAPSAE